MGAAAGQRQAFDEGLRLGTWAAEGGGKRKVAPARTVVAGFEASQLRYGAKRRCSRRAAKPKMDRCGRLAAAVPSAAQAPGACRTGLRVQMSRRRPRFLLEPQHAALHLASGRHR
jgi:hypothetical protein